MCIERGFTTMDMNNEKCVMCDGKDRIIARATWTSLSMCGDRLTAHGDNDCNVQIYYCPFCGRKLD